MLVGTIKKEDVQAVGTALGYSGETITDIAVRKDSSPDGRTNVIFCISFTNGSDHWHWLTKSELKELARVLPDGRIERLSTNHP